MPGLRAQLPAIDGMRGEHAQQRLAREPSPFQKLLKDGFARANWKALEVGGCFLQPLLAYETALSNRKEFCNCRRSRQERTR